MTIWSGRVPLVKTLLPARFSLQLLPILLLGLILRVIALAAPDLWLDEAISYYLSRQSIPQILHYTATHAFEHPPGYYLFLHAWMALGGTSEFWLRYLAAVGGVLGIALVATLAGRWFDRRVAVLAAFLMAIQPMIVQAAREARMYAWTMALVLLAAYAFERAFTRNRWRDWAAFLALTALSVAFHYLAGLALVAYAAFLIGLWPRLGHGRNRAVLTLGVVFGLAFLGVLTQAGPRQTLLEAVGGGFGTGHPLVTVEEVFTNWALGKAAFSLSAPLALALAGLTWLLVLIGIFAPARPRHWERAQLRWLLVCLIWVPPVALALAFALPNPRYSALTLGVFVMAIALGINALWQRWRPAAVVALVGWSGVSLAALYLGSIVAPHEFSAPLTYLSERANQAETIVYTHFADPYQNDYYNARRLPATYIPPSATELTEKEIETQAADVLKGNRSSWLVLYPSVLQPERIEQAFNRLAFPAEKVWFPGGRGVVHYFRPLPLAEQPAGIVWNDEIRLRGWQSSDEAVAAGDALRLQFEWERLQPQIPRALISLALVGPDGAVWAERSSEPCTGWCISSEWPAGAIVDRQALYVPPDVPPGDYDLHIRWLTTPDGEPLLGRRDGDELGQADLVLMQIHVDAPALPTPAAAPLGRRVDTPIRDGLVLRSTRFDDRGVRGGASLALPLQFEVTAPQPALTAGLLLERQGEAVRVTQPLGPAWYASQDWTGNRSVRVQPQFTIPGTLTAGTYQASLEIAEPGQAQPARRLRLGALTVQDRPRRFDVPDIGKAAGVNWSEGIQLVRTGIPAQAAPGTSLTVTLVWQAGRPTSGNWKVFVHLVDANGEVRVQGDDYPMGGSALTPTWKAGEVVLDSYTLSLPPDLAPGKYALRLGFYDERSEERLPLSDGGDNLTLPAALEVTGTAHGNP